MNEYSEAFGLPACCSGGTLEFMSKYEIERKYGYLKDIIGGGYWLRLE